MESNQYLPHHGADLPLNYKTILWEIKGANLAVTSSGGALSSQLSGIKPHCTKLYLPYKVPSQVLGMAYLTWFLECLKESFTTNLTLVIRLSIKFHLTTAIRSQHRHQSRLLASRLVAPYLLWRLRRITISRPCG